MLALAKLVSGALAAATRRLMPVSAILAAVFFRRPAMKEIGETGVPDAGRHRPAIPEAEYSSASGYHGGKKVGVSMESVERYHGSEGRAAFLEWHNAERRADRADSVMLDDGFAGTEVKDYVRWAKGYRPKTTRTCPPAAARFGYA